MSEMKETKKNIITRSICIYDPVVRSIIDYINNKNINSIFLKNEVGFETKKSIDSASSNSKKKGKIKNIEFVDSNEIEITFINFVKYLCTSHSGFYQSDAIKIVDALKLSKVDTKCFRFKSTHVFFENNSYKKNIRLVSAMITLGIPIYGLYEGAMFFDGDIIYTYDD